MQILPAIDLKDQQCVRLKQGRMDDATVFSDNPAEMAQHWESQGATRLHLVDLNGAFAGEPKNLDTIKNIVAACPKLTFQLGGGIRSLDTIEMYLSLGIDQVIIGTQAVKEPEFVRKACEAYPNKIIVGLDAKDGQVAVNGWDQVTEQSAQYYADLFADSGASSIVYTDIGRDGMLQGINIEATKTLAENSQIPIIASGGLHQLDDIKQLCAVAASGIQGVIAGRAIYEGTLNLREALNLVAEFAAEKNEANV